MLLDALTETCAPVNEMRRLALDFRQLFRDGNAQRLDWWLAQATSCGLPDIQTLATSLNRERDALLAAITLPWSNGPTEGVVKRSSSSSVRCTGADRLRRSANVPCSQADPLHGISGRTAKPG